MTDFSPEATAARKRAHAADIDDTDFKQWQHHPVSALMFQYIADLIDASRRNIADFVEAGQVDATNEHQLRNLHCLRGQIATLREIHAIEIATIKGFYEYETAKAEQEKL